jgi:spermidine/putrescine transport system ATP-binding protein
VTLQGQTPDLTLEDVSKSYDEVAAVDSVSLEVGHGEFYSLLGPSGCGKTTTLRLIAGFETADRGRILLAGDDITAMPPNRRRVNTVFQHYALFPHMSVEDNVAYGLKQRKLPKGELGERLTEALRTVRLEELRVRYPRQLSGGQQQRVALARALINEPAVLLLDEPLAALDLKLRKAMQGELKKLQERVGITFVYVTHDQEEALTLSDRIAVMSGGRILQEGSPSEIYERPRTRFVADFIGETNFFEGTVSDTGGNPEVTTAEGLRLVCAPADFVRNDMNVVVSVRPEAISPAHGNANRVTGTLARVSYSGDLVHYHVETEGRQEIVMQLQNGTDSAASDWRVGQKVDLGWDEAQSLVLIDDGFDVAEEQDRHFVQA